MSSNPKSITDYSFEKLLLKLSQLHEFHFDPNSRVKHERTDKDDEKKKEEINEFWGLVKKDLEMNKFQLNSEDYQYLIPKDKEDWGKNPYYKLYSYLQDKDEWFAKFQTEDVKVLWGLFAYVDATSYTEPVKYLFGPSKDVSEKDLNPHFLLHTYHVNAINNCFESVPSKIIDNIAKAAYYSRKKAAKYSDVDFVYVLQSYRKRTDFEFDNDLMYISSGEIDCCILQWLFLILKDENKSYSISDQMHFDVNKVKDEILDKQHRTLIDIPYEESKCKKGILEWLELWGLIQIKLKGEDINSSQFHILPRGLSMLHWMSVYLKALNSNRKNTTAPIVYGKLEPDYWRVLGLRNYMTEGHENNYYYLKEILQEKQNEIINAFNEIDEISQDNAKIQFINLLELMLAWNEKNNEGTDKVWQTFHKRCRFSTFIHYLVRFGENGKPNSEISNIPTGLLAFPVLWDTITLQRQPVGIFMSVIQENIKKGDRYKSCFKDYLEIKEEFEERIIKTRTIINLLAKVENIEIYQRGIRVNQEKERVEKETLLAITDSVHQIKTMMNGKFNPPLMSLLQDNNLKKDSRIKLLDVARLSVIGLAEIINLISKLHQLKADDEELSENDLIKANLFTSMTKEIQLDHIIDDLVALRNLNKNKTEICIKTGDSKLKIGKKFFRYGNLSPNEIFFQILLLTAIENSIEHGSPDKTGSLEIAIKYVDNRLEISNKAKNNINQDIRITGNFKLFQTLAHKLNIGRFIPSAYNENGVCVFKITLQSNN